MSSRSRSETDVPELDGAGTRLRVILSEADSAGLVRLRTAVVEAVRAGRADVTVDLSELDRWSSSTVTALIWAHRRCRARGGGVALSGVSRGGRRMLKRTGLERIFAMIPDDEPFSKEVRAG